MKLETIQVGRIVNAHGIRGEVRVLPRDGDPAFLTQFKTFLLDGRTVTPTACHVHKSVVLMKLPGVDDMNAALALKDRPLFIRRADAHLPEGTYFDDELLGLEVFDADTGALLGEPARGLPAPARLPGHRGLPQGPADAAGAPPGGPRSRSSLHLPRAGRTGDDDGRRAPAP